MKINWWQRPSTISEIFEFSKVKKWGRDAFTGSNRKNDGRSKIHTHKHTLTQEEWSTNSKAIY